MHCVLLPALPGPELSGYSVRLFALWLKTAKHPRYFQGSRQWDLEVVAKLYRAHPGVMVSPMTHFL